MQSIQRTSKPQGCAAKRRVCMGRSHLRVSFLQPEILEIGKDKLDEWMSQPSGKTGIYTDTVLMISSASRRMCAPQKWRKFLGLVSDPLRGPHNSTSMLTNADFKFKPIKDSKGKMLDLTQGNYQQL